MKSQTKLPHKKLKRKNIFSLFIKPSRSYETRINRSNSIWRMSAAPILSVFFGSMITILPFFTEQPILPPFGFIIFIAWRFLRPGMWPMWAGLPFGIFDDIFSGAPMGTGALTWSIAMLVAEFIDSRIIFRDHLFDWLIAAIFIAAYLSASLFIIGFIQPMPNYSIIIPQTLFSIALYPLIVRFCASIDTWRLRK